MRKRGRERQPRIVGDRSDARGMGLWIERYLEAMKVRNYTDLTVSNRRLALNAFATWAEERGLRRVDEISRPILERYQRWLFHFRQENGEPLRVRTQYARLQALRPFFRWLTRDNVILHNPASELELPRYVPALPLDVLSTDEVERVLTTPELSKPQGLRDRAMLETLYSTGMRRMELVALLLGDLDETRGVVAIRKGKGQRMRVVPIGARALAWIAKYRDEARPRLVCDHREQAIFLTRYGEPLSPERLTQICRRHLQDAGLDKKGSCHLFRHTMATLMLENGADIRHIQAMLGHARLDATEVYTHVSIRHLKEVHERTHPARRARDSPEDEHLG